MEPFKHLLAKRFKVIALWPDCPHVLGEVKTFVDLPSHPKLEYYTHFPNIFRKMSWFEDRNEEDLPSFVKYRNEEGKIDDIRKVVQWIYFNNEVVINRIHAFEGQYGERMSLMGDWLPATEIEYLEFHKK